MPDIRLYDFTEDHSLFLKRIQSAISSKISYGRVSCHSEPMTGLWDTHRAAEWKTATACAAAQFGVLKGIEGVPPVSAHEVILAQSLVSKHLLKAHLG